MRVDRELSSIDVKLALHVLFGKAYSMSHVSDIDDCARATCLYDGTCVDGIGEYTCTCPEGRTGQFCEIGKDQNYVYQCLSLIMSYPCHVIFFPTDDYA